LLSAEAFFLISNKIKTAKCLKFANVLSLSAASLIRDVGYYVINSSGDEPAKPHRNLVFTHRHTPSGWSISGQYIFRAKCCVSAVGSWLEISSQCVAEAHELIAECRRCVWPVFAWTIRGFLLNKSNRAN
jgi:hypothetical protein